MPERDAAGLNRLDADRAHSMEDEGGASAALIEGRDSSRAAIGLGVACLVGLAAGAGLVRLLRSR